jgi:hypothetical protein
MEGVNSSVIYLIHCKNFCKCDNVPPTNTIIKKTPVMISPISLPSLNVVLMPYLFMLCFAFSYAYSFLLKPVML